MVTQDLTKVTPKILSAGLLSLRELAIMSRIVNTSYGVEAAQRGSTIDIPLPSAIVGADVTPGATDPSTDGIAPTTVPLQLNNWKSSPFYLTDKELLEAMNGVIPMQASAAIRWLVNQIDISILKEYQKVYQYVGHATYVGFNPDSVYTNAAVQKTKDATDLRLALNKGLAPFNDRMAVVTADVEANALQLRPFQDQSWSGDASALVAGQLNTKLGFRWFMDQNIPAHTAGTITNDPAGTAAAGDTTVSVVCDVDDVANLNPGDLIKFASHSQIYTVVTGATIGNNGTGSISVLPALVVGITSSNITHATSFANGNVYYNGLAFQREALAFASRPFEPVPPGLGVITDQVVDDISGIALRLEVKREHYRTRFSYDALWGVRMVRPELACRFVTVA